MDNSIFIAIIVSELVSLWLIFSLWRMKNQGVIFKVFVSILVVVPIIGPIFFSMLTMGVTVQDVRLQNRGSAMNNLWGWGRYTDNWKVEQERMKKKIDALEKTTKIMRKPNNNLGKD